MKEEMQILPSLFGFRFWRNPRFGVLYCIFLFLFTVCAVPQSHAQDNTAEQNTVTLATLDWEPYTGHAMPGGGAISAFITQALKAKGYDARYGYWPWKRAIVVAWRGQGGALGYFPGYHCHHNPDTDFVTSKVIINTQLGFVHLHDKPLPQWDTLKDLHAVRIGYVTGYASSDEFEALEKSGTLRVFRTVNDASNLKKLLNNQLDAVLIDRFVFEKLVNDDPVLQAQNGAMVFAAKALDAKPLHLCLRNDARGRAVRDAFDAALADMDAGAFITEYFKNSAALP